MPSRNHSIVQTRLLVAFSAFAGFSALSELTLELADGARSTPDIAVYPHLSTDWLHDELRMKTMPLMVVEIVSATQGIQDIVEKLDAYFANGIESAWVVQPAMQAIAIYRPGVSRPQVFTDGEIKDPATGLTARIEEIFA